MPPDEFADSRDADLKQLDRLYHKLRGLMNALGLCVRVMESGPPPREMDEYARLIAETTTEIEQLVQKLGLRNQKP